METQTVENKREYKPTTEREFLKDRANWVRTKVLDMASKSGSGHVTTAFSQAEMLIALYYGGLLRFDPKNPKWDGRDRFILSKGQGGLGFYPILADLGFFPLEELDNFAAEGNILGVHCEWNIPGVETISGSLGHGLPVISGMCEAAVQDKKDHMMVTMVGDAELYEGSNWEALTFAAHRRYDNLVCIIDVNGQGVLGFTDERSNRPCDNPNHLDLKKKFEAFGFETRTCDGHDFDSIFDTLSDLRNRKGKGPLAILSMTSKGHGAELFENQRLWHYRVPKGEELETVRKQLEKKGS